MTHWQQDVESRIDAYASKQNIILIGHLGNGYDGTVSQTSRNTALKGFAFERLFLNEKAVYERLREHEIDEVHGFAVPRMIAIDALLWVIEMEIVSPPFVLDFAGASLDQPLDYPEDVMAEWMAAKREQFGSERWQTVQILMFAFQQMGIYLADVKPGNIMFADLGKQSHRRASS